jgi:hypothetical protein
MKRFHYFFNVKGLSRLSDGLLVAEVDLNLCQQVKDKWGFQVDTQERVL